MICNFKCNNRKQQGFFMVVGTLIFFNLNIRNPWGFVDRKSQIMENAVHTVKINFLFHFVRYQHINFQ